MAGPFTDVDDALAAYDASRWRLPGLPIAAPMPTPGAPPPPPLPMTADAVGVTSGAARPTLPTGPQPAPQPAPRNVGPDPELAAMLRRKRAAISQPAPAQEGGGNRFARLLQGILGGISGEGYDSRFWAAQDAEGERKRKEAIAASDADPASERSQRARAAMAPMLAKLGLEADEIGLLSAADISAMTKGGNLAVALAKARGAAETAKAKAVAEAEAKKEQRTYDAGEFDRRNKITSAQSDARTDKLAGITTGRMIQGALLQDALATKRAEAARAAAAGQADATRKASEQAKIDEELRKADTAEVNEIVTLQGLRARLAKRSPADKLPGSEGFVGEKIVAGKAVVQGGTGRSDADSRLDNDLTAAGLQSYINTAKNAPNSEREQEIANRKFRGNGTAGSAIEAIDARLREIQTTRAERAKARNAAPAAKAPALSSDPAEADLGIEDE